MSAIPAPVLETVRARSGGACEGCHAREASEMHHRRFRSRGGQHTAANLLHLCGWGNHTGCHGIAHSQAGHDKGWSVNSWADPAATPIEHAVHGLVLLDDDGGVHKTQEGAGPWAFAE
jgi:hypothetical protein